MCGIVGIVSEHISIKEKEQLLNKMSELIIHRGPDDRGLWVNDSIGLATCRLSIIDLTKAGHQPMHFAEAGLTIVYNGEVYNYKEIREELEKKGHIFQGNSDTEVVLHSFKEWNIDCFNKFNGMFALAIWDQSSKKLYIARDRFGVKPLFYWHKGKELVFGSEFKVILKYPEVERKIDRSNLFQYMVYNSPQCPNTLLDDVKQIIPGTVMIFNDDGSAMTHVYWKLPELIPDNSLTEKQVINTVEEILYDSIRLRLRSDVPVGVFLSGGIDSSLITAIACRIQSGIQTFSIGYLNEKEDESHFAQKVSQYIGTLHHNIFIEPEHLDIDVLKKAADDPLANVTMVPYLQLAGFAAKHVKVVLNGDGGDEFFCGYTRFLQASRILKLKNIISAPIWNTVIKACIRFFRKGILNRNFRLLNFNSPDEFLAQLSVMMPIGLVTQLISPRPKIILTHFFDAQKPDYSFLQMNYNNAKTYMINTVLKTSDRATMAYSLEGRSPFMDYRLVEFAGRIPQRIQFKRSIPKYVLKEILYRYVPRKLVDRPKRGFSLPLRNWLKGPWGNILDQYLSLGSIKENGILNKDRVSEVLKSFRQGVVGSEVVLWHLLIFQIWYETYIEAGNA
jgi:asparagine synthase (glutamine-hydrolysing)